MKTSSGVARIARLLLLVSGVLVTPAQVMAQTSGQAATYTLHIPAQPLANSLQLLGRQTGINVLFDPQVLRGVHAPAVRGTYTVTTALTRLLSASDLTWRFTSPGTVDIEAKPPQRRKPPESSQRQAAEPEQTLSTINVTGYAKALTATRADTAIREIPQTINVISRETLDQQNAVDVTSALQQAPGIMLSQFNSQDMTISSRGFSVNSVHVDGGAPINVIDGQVDITSLDLAQFENVTVLRGSDALFGGMGNPGASISLARKEPTSTPQGSFTALYGSWDQQRLVGDYSTPLTSTLSARVVVAGTDRGYYYNIAHAREGMGYGVIKWDPSKSTTLSVGLTDQVTNAINNFNGLPLYANGAKPDLPRSLALTTPWSKTQTILRQAFIKFDQKVGSRWDLALNSTYLSERMPRDTSATFYAAIDPLTNIMQGSYEALNGNLDNRQLLFNGTLTGSFDWLGQKQRVMVGADYERNIFDTTTNFLNYVTPPINPFDYDLSLYPRPDMTPLFGFGGSTVTWQSGFYGSVQIHPTRPLGLTLGGRVSRYGESIDGEQTANDKGKFTPYAGVTYDLGKHYTAYVSYADIYHTNAGLTSKDGRVLPPANGDTLEAGLKGAWFANTLNASVAWFNTKQTGNAVLDPSVPPQNNCCYLTEADKSQGLEFTVTGSLTPRWQATVGYTYDIHSRVNTSFSSRLPRNLLKVWTNYILPDGKWSVGGGLRAISAGFNSECEDFGATTCLGSVAFGQGFYTVVDLRAAYNINSDWSVAVNLNNAFDRRYWQTLSEVEVGNFYGAPRNFMVRLQGNF